MVSFSSSHAMFYHVSYAQWAPLASQLNLHFGVLNWYTKLAPPHILMNKGYITLIKFSSAVWIPNTAWKNENTTADAWFYVGRELSPWRKPYSSMTSTLLGTLSS